MPRSATKGCADEHWILLDARSVLECGVERQGAKPCLGSTASTGAERSANAITRVGSLLRSVSLVVRLSPARKSGVALERFPPHSRTLRDFGYSLNLGHWPMKARGFSQATRWIISGVQPRWRMACMVLGTARGSLMPQSQALFIQMRSA
ncbi:hypothetical protein EI77_03711 [Prosthecobacter fusiformis]|uniref:Uncharacterized protein n=1 Tax=Prosthecobacter fusiformis TaxID=48464 RepID=A0A4R7RPN5_9BACT|nr:hypothetical protein EI77_03711 [Prosthecobacter fusiformis]